FSAAFTKQPALAEDVETWDRYKAAGAAALAGCGQGKDAVGLTANERANWRRQALDWLRADLKAWGQLLDKAPGKAPHAANILQPWQVDADLSGVRGPEALARLPEPERQPWQKLWGDVAELLAGAQRKATPEKKSNSK